MKDYNGITNLYTSIYQIRKNEYKIINNRKVRKYSSVIIDKLFYDLDIFKTCWHKTQLIHKSLMKEDIKHTVILSGGGFHPYIFTEPLKIEDLKQDKTEQHLKFILKNAQQGVINNIINPYLSKEDKITYGYQKTCDIDSHVIGDIGRIARIPNTWHPKRKRYAIPIIKNDFTKSFEEILQLSKHQRPEFEVFGSKLINLKDYDKNFTQVKNNIKLRDNGYNLKDLEGIITLLPKFIQTLLITKDDGCRARYYTIVSMKVRGFPKSIAEDLCEKHWSEEKFKHALYGHGYNEFDYIYGRHDIFFPNWQTLIDEGWDIPEEDIKDYKLMYNR